MTPAEFRTVGEALRGPSWQRAIASALGRNERDVRHYAAGTRPIPDAVAHRLLALLYEHAAELSRLARTLRA